MKTLVKDMQPYEWGTAMNHLRIVTRSKNLEIISKLMNSVAKQVDCKITYCAERDCIRFHGETDYQKYITEKTLSFFKAA